MPSDPPPQDKRLTTVRRDGPEPQLLYGDVTGESERPDSKLMMAPERSSSMSIFTFAGAFVLIALIVVFFITYFSEHKPEPRKATIGQPLAAERLVTPPPASATPPSWGSGNTIPVFAEMLKVSAIAMGKTPLAIVNGQRLAEGDWLDVKTDRGVATVVVQKIDDGVVHFRNGEMTIDAKMSTNRSPKPAP